MWFCQHLIDVNYWWFLTSKPKVMAVLKVKQKALVSCDTDNHLLFSSVGEILIKGLPKSDLLYFLDCPCRDFSPWHYSFLGCWRLPPVPQTALLWLIHIWRSYIITVDISVENTEPQFCDYHLHHSILLWGLSAFLKENLIKNLASLQRISILVSWLLAIRASSLCWHIRF